MPLVHVQMASGRSDQQKAALLTALTDAVEAQLGAPRETIRVWITEFADTDYMAGGELLSDRRARRAPPDPDAPLR